MTTLRIACQQELTSFGEDAAHQLWGGDVDLMLLPDLGDISSAVATGAADRGVLPIEHTILGSVQASHDALDAAPEIVAVAETVIRSQLYLLGPLESSLDAVGDVFCHPIALAQCRKFFRAHPRITVHSVLDTAASVADVENLADPQFAVVAGRAAMLSHHVAVVAPDIQDRPDTQTRFLGVSTSRQPLPPGTPARTTCMITVDDVPGALLHGLAPFAAHGINMRRIEGRPTGAPWVYRFFLEFDHQSGDPGIDSLLDELARTAKDMRWLGTYPRWNAGRRGSIGWRSGSILPVD
ncbi:MAG: hypothetical protein IT356_02505 [Gemmatimonadaceae bacterium]|nr:hypothetical protein [Gemmatimonadaceae bacterium]